MLALKDKHAHFSHLCLSSLKIRLQATYQIGVMSVQFYGQSDTRLLIRAQIQLQATCQNSTQSLLQTRLCKMLNRTWIHCHLRLLLLTEAPFTMPGGIDFCCLFITVTPPCKDTQCKDNVDVRTTQLGTLYCMLTAVAPLSQDFLVQGHVSWYAAVVIKKSHCTA